MGMFNQASILSINYQRFIDKKTSISAGLGEILGDVYLSYFLSYKKHLGAKNKYDYGLGLSYSKHDYLLYQDQDPIIATFMLGWANHVEHKAFWRLGINIPLNPNYYKKDVSYHRLGGYNVFTFQIGVNIIN
jgi:hypothetical protein